MEAYSYLSLAIQLAVKNTQGKLVNVGYTDMRLRDLFPAELNTPHDEKLPMDALKVREKMLRTSKSSNKVKTVETRGDIFYYSVKIGTIRMGLRQRKLKMPKTDLKQQNN